MENRELYLVQIQRRFKQNTEELKALISRLRNEDIEIPQELVRSVRLQEEALQQLTNNIRKQQNETKQNSTGSKESRLYRKVYI